MVHVSKKTVPTKRHIPLDRKKGQFIGAADVPALDAEMTTTDKTTNKNKKRGREKRTTNKKESKTKKKEGTKEMMGVQGKTKNGEIGTRTKQ